MNDAIPGASLSNSLRVLCCFGNHDSARTFEHALAETGISLLRARHGMHAYWLAIASHPTLIVIDATQMDLQNDFLLSRIANNQKLTHVPVVVITDETLPFESSRFSTIGTQVAPSDLAKRVEKLIVEVDRQRQQNVDEIFSHWDDVPAEQEFSPDRVIRTDAAGENVGSRPRQEPVPHQPVPRRLPSRLGK